MTVTYSYQLIVLGDDDHKSSSFSCSIRPNLKYYLLILTADCTVKPSQKVQKNTITKYYQARLVLRPIRMQHSFVIIYIRPQTIEQ